MSGEYGWRIDRDYITPKSDGAYCEGKGSYAVGTEGPHDWKGLTPSMALEGAQTFRLLDDDGNVNYRGVIVTEDGSEAEQGYEDVAFGPLTDFGEGFSGCTEIQYKHGEEWVTL